jgi:hypothetical protein
VGDAPAIRKILNTNSSSFIKIFGKYPSGEPADLPRLGLTENDITLPSFGCFERDKFFIPFLSVII